MRRVNERLVEIGAVRRGEDFEENTLYAGGTLDPQSSVLRLRRVADGAVLTYKEVLTLTSSVSTVKRRREDETRVEDADALAAILEALGFTPALVYEKRRATWEVADAEVVVDELPFGLFLEIEGEESEILEVERLLDLSAAEVEMATYPELTVRFGSKRDGMIEARFRK
ncbi:MAG: class IV adenylate cyclase [Pyrinomonadaceae bacterium]|nr:class IV adenylate cyclase [Pyrinomonadaceae bacterium]